MIFKTSMEQLLFFKLVLVFCMFGIFSYFIAVVDGSISWIVIIGGICGMLGFILLSLMVIFSFFFGKENEK